MTLSSDLHLLLYKFTFDLDGVTRRNAKRAQDAADTSMWTFNIRLQESGNHQSSSLGMPLLFQ